MHIDVCSAFNVHVDFCFAGAAEAVSCDAKSVLTPVTNGSPQKCSLIITDHRRCRLLLESQFHDGGVAAFIDVGARGLLQRADDQTNWDEVWRRERGRASEYLGRSSVRGVPNVKFST